MREATISALEITEDPYRAITCGQLEAKVAEGNRAQALAPPDVSGQLRLTAQAEADAWQQSRTRRSGTTRPRPLARKRWPG